jgi:hypothetical protein
MKFKLLPDERNSSSEVFWGSGQLNPHQVNTGDGLLYM